MSTPVPGTCRYCGCPGDSCTLANGDKCAWFDSDRTVCTRSGCMRAELVRARAVKPADTRPNYRGWGYGAIQIEERKRRERERRRRRRKAA